MADDTPVPAGPTPTEPEPVPEPKDQPEEPTSEGAETEASEPPELADLRAKYPGKSSDEILAEVAKSYFHQANSNADLRAELDEIKTLLQAKEQPEEGSEPELEPEEPEVDVQAIDEDIQALQSLMQTHEERKGGTLRKLGEVQQRIGYIRGRLEAAIDDEKPHWRSQLTSVESEQDRLMERFSDLTADDSRHNRDMKSLQRMKANALKQQETVKARQKTLARDRADSAKQRQQRINQDYDAAIKSHATDLKIPKDLTEDFDSQVHALTLSWLWQHQGERAVDMKALTRHLAERVAQSYDRAARASFQKTSQTKLETTRKVAPASAPATRTSSRPQPKAGPQQPGMEDPDAIRERIQQYHIKHAERVAARVRSQSRRPA